jgi:hypothetical protein
LMQIKLLRSHQRFSRLIKIDLNQSAASLL